MTNVEISIVQVGVLLRLCFEPIITYIALGETTGGTDRLLWQAGIIFTILQALTNVLKI